MGMKREFESFIALGYDIKNVVLALMYLKHSVQYFFTARKSQLS